MSKLSRFKLFAVAAGLIALLTAVGGLVISQAAGGQSGIRALIYNDAVRFVIGNEKVSILRAEVFDLAGKRLFDSGPVMGKALDWAMTTETGERVAHGVYLYVITAWDSQGQLVKSQVGKLALVPGGVGLGQAPPLVSEDKGSLAAEKGGGQVGALDYDHTGNFTITGRLGVGTDQPTAKIDVVNDNDGWWGLRFFKSDRSRSFDIARFNHNVAFNASLPDDWFSLRIGNKEKMRVTGSGNVGIGTTSPSAALEVKGSTANLLVLKNASAGGATVFRVENDGDVYAAGSYHSGGADVAERINVSEPVESADVVEIDPEHPGFYRRAQDPYSTRVAGVISTAPGVALGNAFDAQAKRWKDEQVLLALAGRVPVKVTTENGPIKIGDFLTTSSKPGYAMRCDKLAKCTGVILGKALEHLEKGNGMIQVQVMLR